MPIYRTAPGDVKRYYVWVHGIFAVYKAHDHISLVSPNLESTPSNQHIYKVGRVVDGHYDHVVRLPIGNYNLAGLSPSGNSHSLQDVYDIEVDGTLKDYANGDVLEINLRYPDDIFAIRPVLAMVDNPHDAASPNPGPVTKFISLLHVLVYNDVDPANVCIPGVWNPYLGSNHLHFFAEPADPHNHQPQEALKELLYLFDGADFVLRPKGNDCAPLTNVLSFCDDLREQFSLAEWAGRCQYRKADHPKPRTITANECPNVVVKEP